MLLNRDTAEGIANGTITLVLRRWDAPQGEAGRHTTDTGGHHPHRRRHRVSRRIPRDGRAGARRRAIPTPSPRRRSWTAGRPGTPTPSRCRTWRPTNARNSPPTTNSATTTSTPSARGCSAGTPRPRTTVDAAVPRVDRGQRGGPGSRPRRARRPGDAAVQAPGTPAQGSGPDHQPRRRLPNFAARARIPGVGYPTLDS